jgi:hypothetical protein
MARARRGLALVVAFGGLALGGFLFVRFNQTVQAPMALAANAAQSSTVVRSALGEPLRFGRLPRAKVRGNNARLGVSVSGPLGSGTLIEWAQQTGGQWRICSLAFRPNDGSGSVDLVESETTRCEPE